jgi:hypothetical protein
MSLIPTGFAKNTEEEEYLINQSLRFDRSGSDYMRRTPSSSGNLTTWTMSAWVKRKNAGSGTTNYLYNGASTNDTMYFSSTDRFVFYNQSNAYVYTPAVFNSNAEWFHLVVVWDTTNATAGDRIRIYKNNVRQDDGGTDPSLNATSGFNNTSTQTIGRSNATGNYLDAYVADFHFIDGQALDPDSFGKDDGGTWVPIGYTGSYGTNGYFLDFADGSAIGDDESGNGNDWTVYNLNSGNVVSDSPTS